MSELENDDYTPDEGHSGAHRHRRTRYHDVGESGSRPGQRGKNRREPGEKPVVQVKWNQQLTEELWNLIKVKPDLKRVLVNEPSRHLGPHGPGSQLFSKKDLQRTIAQMLFQDSGYNLNDALIMENLTRAVKNKLHKTQMLYEASLEELPPGFTTYTSEQEIPAAHRAQWAKVKDRFPTFFEYNELALEIPAILAQMEQDAQTLGAWKAKALSGSEDGSPNSFISKRRSRSVESSASWEVPSPPLRHRSNSELGPDFEVRPPPSDHQQAPFSDLESLGGPHAMNVSPGLSPAAGVSPLIGIGSMTNPQSSHLNSDQAAPWSPSIPGPISPINPLSRTNVAVGAGNTASAHASPHINNNKRGLPDDGQSSMTTQVDQPASNQPKPIGRQLDLSQSLPYPISPYSGEIKLGPQPYNTNSILQAGSTWSQAPTAPPSQNPVKPATHQSQSQSSRYPSLPIGGTTPDGRHLTASSAGQPDGSSSNPRKRRRGGHERTASTGVLSSGEFPPESALSASPQAASPLSAAYYSSSSGSPSAPKPSISDSPTEKQTLEALLAIIKAKENRRKHFEEEMIRYKKRKLDDREKQRVENERQREERRLQREHEMKMMEQKIRLAQYEAEAHQRANSVTTTSNMGSPTTTQDIMSSLTPYQSNAQEMPYGDEMMLFQQFSSPPQNNYEHPITNIMSMTHPPNAHMSPMHMSRPLQQAPAPQHPHQHHQQHHPQQQQQHLVGGVGAGMMGMNALQSPISQLQLQMVDSNHMSIPSPMQQLQSQGNPRDQYPNMMGGVGPVGGADHGDVNEFSFLGTGM